MPDTLDSINSIASEKQNSQREASGQETNKAEGKKERKKQETVPTYP